MTSVSIVPPDDADWYRVSQWLNATGRAVPRGGVVALDVAAALRDRLAVQRFGEAFERADGTSTLWHRKPSCVAVTIDYELYEPPEARHLAVNMATLERQMLEPMRRMFTIAERHGAKLTLFVEVCQLWLLRDGFPDLAAAVEAQLTDAIRRGHDVQLHAHIRWYDKAGGRADAAAGVIRRGHTDRIHGLDQPARVAFFKRGKSYLEALLQPIDPSYRCTVFRAGKYQIQPHREVFAALREAGFIADTSAWLGGHLPLYDNEPGFDYRDLWHPFEPYRPDAAQLNWPSQTPSAADLVELPILSSRTGSWTFDTPNPDPQIALYDAVAGFGGPRIMIGHSKLFDQRCGAALDAILAHVARDPHAHFETTAKIAARAAAAMPDPSHVARARVARRESVRRLGASPAARHVHDQIATLSPGDGSIVVSGTETGETLALPLARLSKRPVAVPAARPESAQALADIAASEHLSISTDRNSPTQAVAIVMEMPAANNLDREIRDARTHCVDGGALIVVASEPASIPARLRNARTSLTAATLRLPEPVQRRIVEAYALVRSRSARVVTIADPLDPARPAIGAGSFGDGAAASPQAIIAAAERAGFALASRKSIITRRRHPRVDGLLADQVCLVFKTA